MSADMVHHPRFISLEGTEGVGKSTLIQGLTHMLQSQGLTVLCTREPGGTPLAEKIRSLLLATDEEVPCVATELLLLFAARAQHCHEVILPALDAGKWVICDRFVDASYAYQCGGRGLDSGLLDRLCADFVPVMPSLTLWLDAPVAMGLQRVRGRNALDRFEQEKQGFFDRVHAVYQSRALAEPERIQRINAQEDAAGVLAQASSHLGKRIIPSQ